MATKPGLSWRKIFSQIDDLNREYLRMSANDSRLAEIRKPLAELNRLLEETE